LYTYLFTAKMVTHKAFYCNVFRECTYVVSAAGEAIVIDPGCYGQKECERLGEYIQSNQLVIKHVLCTHAHLDHLFGARYIYDKFGLLPSVHEADIPLFQSMDKQAQMFGIELLDPALTHYHVLHSHQLIMLGDVSIEVLPCPGHTQGGVAYYINSPDQTPMLFSGDSLFQGSIGRTDLPGGDAEQLISSIRQELLRLPDNTEVYPGHGLPTLIGYEKEHNPWLQ